MKVEKRRPLVGFCDGMKHSLGIYNILIDCSFTSRTWHHHFKTFKVQYVNFNCKLMYKYALCLCLVIKCIEPRVICIIDHVSFLAVCPPGPFTISFSLPVPVDPRLFLPDLRSDGILEVVMKYRKLDA
uniref:Uncharacterized protein n=1 Tax=Nelumbo nucifera TaxID=4432 RepID=A0A822XPG6_NELNU|nr:TPA_asm: hypothetical protein HUJ06_023783 [Nelumbo nucifera]